MLVDGKKLIHMVKIMSPTNWREECIPPDETRVLKEDVLNFISKCQVPIQSVERIEAAIRWFDQTDVEMRRMDFSHRWTRMKTPVEVADLLRWVLTGEKDQNTWTDKGLGL